MLPELRARAFTVSGIEGANVMQRVQDAIAGLPQGIGPDGEAYTWETQKQLIVDELEPFLGEEGAATRAQTLLRTSGFQAFTSATWQTAQADEDTTHLQYMHGDQAKDPTPSHEALDGVVLPKDDPFWKTHTGPWGHLGCVCYVRPMNEDLVQEERAKDAAKIAKGAPPENANVMEGAVATQLRNGTLMREGRRYDVSPPEGEGAFKWHPDDLRIPLGELKQRYDAPVWTAFELWARKTQVEPGLSVWKWLEGGETKGQVVPVKPVGGTKPVVKPPPPEVDSRSQVNPGGLAALKPSGERATMPPEVVGKDEQLAGMNDRARAKVAAHEAEIAKLPHERCLVFDDNGEVILTEDGDVAHVDLNSEQQRLLRGRVVTHNHPLGVTFSLQDMVTACTYQIGELRVITNENTFSIRNGSHKLDPRNLDNVVKAIQRLRPKVLSRKNLHEAMKTVAKENGLHYVVT